MQTPMTMLTTALIQNLPLELMLIAALCPKVPKSSNGVGACQGSMVLADEGHEGLLSGCP